MADVAIVKSFERISDDDGNAVQVTADDGSEALTTADHYDGCGVDAPPLAGDFVALKDATGSGTTQAVGYADVKNAGKALGGERRTYARDPDGNVVAEIWAKGTGDITITSLKSGGKITLNGVEIDQDGNISAPGDVTAKAGTPAKVTLTQHVHPTGVGPSGKPTPGQ